MKSETESVSFTDLSRNPKGVAARAAALGRLPLMKQDDGAGSPLLALPEVFPWVRHLDAEEVRAFTVELLGAFSDAAELDAGEAVQRAIISWRATARINSEPHDEPGRSNPEAGQALKPEQP
ncbi:prevent-host-death family protein [Streptomyces paludis]|uniref:prevent-host-death family protein n=1 Tax=Streptomyces paludis TaxID=2282738 RepID=UPI001E47DB6E|nr:prevent-host-death family protein [Streptomyces paludis]